MGTYSRLSLVWVPEPKSGFRFGSAQFGFCRGVIAAGRTLWGQTPHEATAGLEMGTGGSEPGKGRGRACARLAQPWRGRGTKPHTQRDRDSERRAQSRAQPSLQRCSHGVGTWQLKSTLETPPAAPQPSQSFTVPAFIRRKSPTAALQNCSLSEPQVLLFPRKQPVEGSSNIHHQIPQKTPPKSIPKAPSPSPGESWLEQEHCTCCQA